MDRTGEGEFPGDFRNGSLDYGWDTFDETQQLAKASSLVISEMALSIMVGILLMKHVAEPSLCSVFFLSAWSIHVIFISGSLAIQVVSVSASAASCPKYTTSYSLPFLPLRRPRRICTWPVFLSMSRSSSSVSSR